MDCAGRIPGLGDGGYQPRLAQRTTSFRMLRELTLRLPEKLDNRWFRSKITGNSTNARCRKGGIHERQPADQPTSKLPAEQMPWTSRVGILVSRLSLETKTRNTSNAWNAARSSNRVNSATWTSSRKSLHKTNRQAARTTLVTRARARRCVLLSAARLDWNTSGALGGSPRIYAGEGVLQRSGKSSLGFNHAL